MCLKSVIVIVTLAMCVHLSLCSDGPAEEDKAISNTVVDRVKGMVQSIAGGSEYNGNAPESVGVQPDSAATGTTTTTPVPQYGGMSPDAAVCACHDGDET